jgi:SAM-dependent methyltransferase
MLNQKKESSFFSSVSEATNLYYQDKFKKYINAKFYILDFGCGSGEFLKLIKCKYKVGIEINKFTQKKLKKKKLLFFSKIEHIQKNIKFDTIFALSVLDHLKDPISFIKKLSNKLKKDGIIIIIIRHDHKKQSQKNSFYRKHLYSWSLLSFNNLLNSVGLKSIEDGVVKMTLPPLFNFFKKILGIKILLLLSRIYFYFNFNDRRFYFICKKI